MSSPDEVTTRTKNMHGDGSGDTLTPNVVVQVTYDGKIHTCQKVFSFDRPDTHDVAVVLAMLDDAARQVRDRLDPAGTDQRARDALHESSLLNAEELRQVVAVSDVEQQRDEAIGKLAQAERAAYDRGKREGGAPCSTGSASCSPRTTASS